MVSRSGTSRASRPSLALPGGKITGFTILEHFFTDKWLEMLKEVVATVTRVAVLQNPDHAAWSAYQRVVSVIRAFYGRRSGAGAGVQSLRDHGGDRCLRTEPNGGLIVLPSAVGTRHRGVIAEAALRHGLPSIYQLRMYPASGGLMSYGILQAEMYAQAYVAATKFEMVINLKTAKALGITVPATMLGRADEVIE